jgi:hypothetical protein
LAADWIEQHGPGIDRLSDVARKRQLEFRHGCLPVGCGTDRL